MKLGFVERRFMPFAKTTEIRDEEGNVRYYLTRDAVCVGFKLHLLDLSGNEIALIIRFNKEIADEVENNPD